MNNPYIEAIEALDKDNRERAERHMANCGIGIDAGCEICLILDYCLDFTTGLLADIKKRLKENPPVKVNIENALDPNYAHRAFVCHLSPAHEFPDILPGKIREYWLIPVEDEDGA